MGDASEWVSSGTVLTLFSICGMISLLSLLVIFSVFWYIPDFKNLQGRILFCNCISTTFLTSFFLCVYNIDIDSDQVCRIIGYFGYYSAIAEFSWILILAVDLSISIYRGLMDGQRDGRRFLFYSFFGWGFGLLLSCILFTLENVLHPASDFHASFGEHACFISTDGNKLLFMFHLPLLFMMVFNLVAFSFIIIHVALTCKHLEQNQIKIKSSYVRYKLSS